MNQDDMRDRITSAVNALTPSLWEAQGYALADARRRCHGLEHATYPSLRPTVVRPCFREYLLVNPLPRGWTIGGDATRMVEIYVQTEGVRLRYLKERRDTYPGGVPAAGTSRARQAYWMPTLFEEADGEVADPGINLLLLWDSRLDSHGQDDGFVMRVVHTIGTGAWGRRTPIVLSAELSPRLGLEEHLAFTGQPQDTDFFADLSENKDVTDGTA